MKIIYKSGQEMPENVQSAMRYISKIGFMSTAQWHRTFGTGNLRWRQKQLKSLQEKKFIRKHTSSDRGYWVLGSDGHKVLAAMKRDPVTPASALQFVHDEFVGESLVRLEMAGVCEYWLSEAELKYHGAREWLLKSRDKKIKYPDALIDVRIKEKDWKIALEYERIGKSYRRYRDLLLAYESGNNLALIIYIVEDPSIKRRIQKVVSDLGSQYLLGRIAFAVKEEWIKDPAACELEFNNGKVILRDACTLYR
jgi:hypothetical protein